MKSRRNLLTVTLASTVLIVFLFSLQGQRVGAQSTSSGSFGHIEHTPRVVSEGKARLLSHLDPALKMRVRFVLSPPNQEELARFVKDVQDPQSPTFHRFLTFDEWKARYAPSDADVDAVINWAESNGLTLTYRFGTNLEVVMDGDVEAVEKVVGVKLNKYEWNGQRFYSNDRDPVVPSHLTTIVQDVLGLNGQEVVHSGHSAASLLEEPVVKTGPFRVDRTTVSGGGRPGSSGSGGSLEPAFTGGNPQEATRIEPPDLWSSQAYDYAALQAQGHCCNPTNNPGGTPKEESIAVVGQNAPQDSDWQTFFQQYRLTRNVTEIAINGPACCDNEMTFDIEWAAATSNSSSSPLNSAQIFVYEGGGTQFSDLFDAWHMAMQDNNARVLTTSFGNTEDIIGRSDILDFDSKLTFPMAGMGWSMVAAAGDHGAYDDCETLSVHYPASDPYVIAVGGTNLSLSFFGGKLVYGGEAAWGGNGCGNPPNIFNNNGGGGGGCSSNFFANPWQPQGCGRPVPDIALNAFEGQAVFYGFPEFGQAPGWQAVGGTSIAAPEMAGFFAQANAYLDSLGNICGALHNARCAPLGNPGPALYAAPNKAPHNPFYDITQGCNGGEIISAVPGTFPPQLVGTQQRGYCANQDIFPGFPGYDQATGFGSANMLQFAWAINSFMVTNGFMAPVTQPVITFGPSLTLPVPNHWYNTDQLVNFTVGGAAEGIAGFTAQWDNDPGDPTTHATPGSGDPFWDGPQVPNGTSGALSLAAAGQGCHTAFVRAWSNSGQGSAGPGTYGPVCLDTAPPVITCEQPPSMWFGRDVAILCTAVDPLSGLAKLSDANFLLTTSVPNGTETSTATTNTHTVCDVAGNCVTAGPIGPIKVDKKPPSIVISQPAQGGVYLHNGTLTLMYSVTDGGSGVAGFTPTMDGSTTLAGHGLSSSQVINLLTELSTGTHTFAISATDNVGNQGSSSVTFTIIVTPSGLIAEVNQFLSSGAINNSAIAGAWLVMLNQALAARNNGNCVAAAGLYGAFANAVMAQSGRAITPTAASILIADAQYLINHCP